MTEDSSGEKDLVSFRMASSKVEELDDLIWKNKVEENLPRDANRSDLLRQAVDDLMEKLEGNSETPATRATPATSD